MNFNMSIAPCLIVLLMGVTSARALPVVEPLVLFILADDMRPDCIGALGNPNIKTPNLDKLVERGMTFKTSYVLGSAKQKKRK